MICLFYDFQWKTYHKFIVYCDWPEEQMHILPELFDHIAVVLGCREMAFHFIRNCYHASRAVLVN